MKADNFEEAFNTWWEPDPDSEGDNLPYEDISKEKQRAIFMAGYLWGSHRPAWQMSADQYKAIVNMVEEKIRKEKEA